MIILFILIVWYRSKIADNILCFGCYNSDLFNHRNSLKIPHPDHRSPILPYIHWLRVLLSTTLTCRTKPNQYFTDPLFLSLMFAIQEANATFRILLNESTRRLKLSGKKLGSSIEKSRPYHEALEKARIAQIECQKAAAKFQRANGKLIKQQEET